MAGPDRSLVAAERKDALAVEDHEYLLLKRVAVRRSSQLLGRHLDVLEPGLHGSRGEPEVPPHRLHPPGAERDRVHLGDIDNRGRTRSGLGHLRRTELGFADELDWGPVDSARERINRAPTHQREPQAWKTEALVVE